MAIKKPKDYRYQQLRKRTIKLPFSSKFSGVGLQAQIEAIVVDVYNATKNNFYRGADIFSNTYQNCGLERSRTILGEWLRELLVTYIDINDIINVDVEMHPYANEGNKTIISCVFIDKVNYTQQQFSFMKQ